MRDTEELAGKNTSGFSIEPFLIAPNIIPMHPRYSFSLTVAAVLTCACLVTGAQDSGSKNVVQLTELADRVRVEINGAPFTEYFFKDVPRPFCYPLLGPGGLPMTRNWPMKDTSGEEHDHKHHRSLWFTHGEVNG